MVANSLLAISARGHAPVLTKIDTIENRLDAGRAKLEAAHQLHATEHHSETLVKWQAEFNLVYSLAETGRTSEAMAQLFEHNICRKELP